MPIEGIPSAGAYTLLFVLWSLLFIASPLGLAYWVHRDAAARGSDNPLGWAIGALIGYVLTLAIYLYMRKRIGPRTYPPTQLDRGLITVVTTIMLSFLGSSVLGPPDPFTQLYYGSLVLILSIPLAYLLVYRRGYRRLAERL